MDVFHNSCTSVLTVEREIKNNTDMSRLLLSILCFVTVFFSVVQAKTVVSILGKTDLDYDGYHYSVHSGSGMTCLEAWKWCDKQGGVLPSVHSSSDVKWMKQLVPNQKVWLGGRYHGYQASYVSYSQWIWMDGSPYDYDVIQNPEDSCRTSGCCCPRVEGEHIYGRASCETIAAAVCRLSPRVRSQAEKTAKHENQIRNLTALLANADTRQQELLNESLANATLIANEGLLLLSQRDTNLTNRFNQLMLDTMSETSLRLRLLETALNVSMTAASQSLARSLNDFSLNASATEQLMRRQASDFARNFALFLANATNTTNERLILMDLFLNSSSISLNSSLDRHTDIVQTVLLRLKQQVEQDSRENTRMMDRMFGLMSHRITVQGVAILVNPLFFVLVLVFVVLFMKRTRGRIMSAKSEQTLPLNHFSQ